MNPYFIELTELWQDREYDKVVNIINEFHWSNGEMIAFCAYFCKYLGREELEVLCKFFYE